MIDIQGTPNNDNFFVGPSVDPNLTGDISVSLTSAAAVVAQQPYLIGKTAVDNVARYLAGERTLPPATYVPSILVSKDNAAEAQKTLGQADAK